MLLQPDLLVQLQHYFLLLTYSTLLQPVMLLHPMPMLLRLVRATKHLIPRLMQPMHWWLLPLRLGLRQFY